MDTKSDGFRLRRMLFPAGYYGANSVYQGYISLFYTNLGFHSGQLGLLHGATAAATLMFQPLWGWLGDRASRRRELLALLSLAAALAFPLRLLGDGFIWQMACAALFYAFFCALLPLGDTLLLACGDAFGAYRLAGGVSFAIAGAVYGLVLPRLGERGLWIVSILLAGTAAAALLLPNVPGQRKQRGGMSALLRDRQLVLLLLFTLPLQMTMSYYYAFYAPRFKAAGGSDALLGLGYLLSAAGEAPYLIFSRQIYRRWGAVGPMCAASAVLGLRWLMLGLVNRPIVLVLSQMLHGGGFIVITVSMAYWIDAHVDAGLRASGQGLLNMVAFGLARIGGSLLGGWAARGWGMEGGFLACAVICASVGAGLVALTKRPFQKENFAVKK